MNRPLLPYAISSVPASELSFEAADPRAFALIIAGLLESFDLADSTAITVADTAYAPVSARAHVNRARRNPVPRRLLASA